MNKWIDDYIDGCEPTERQVKMGKLAQKIKEKKSRVDCVRFRVFELEEEDFKICIEISNLTHELRLMEKE